MANKKTGAAKLGSRNATDKGMIQRLKDQRKVQEEIAKIHANPRLLKEMAFYPAHDKRLETPLYKKSHDHLTKTLDLPCLVCGVKNSTLKDKTKNRYGAKAMETHHHIIEWALANAIDADKFNAIILPHLKVRHPQNDDHKKDAFTPADVAAWVDHSEDNLWVLCDVHHRAQYFGIHEITYPIWCPMDLLLDNFEQYVRQQIGLAKGRHQKACDQGGQEEKIESGIGKHYRRRRPKAAPVSQVDLTVTARNRHRSRFDSARLHGIS